MMFFIKVNFFDWLPPPHFRDGRKSILEGKDSYPIFSKSKIINAALPITDIINDSINIDKVKSSNKPTVINIVGSIMQK